MVVPDACRSDAARAKVAAFRSRGSGRRFHTPHDATKGEDTAFEPQRAMAGLGELAANAPDGASGGSKRCQTWATDPLTNLKLVQPSVEMLCNHPLGA